MTKKTVSGAKESGALACHAFNRLIAGYIKTCAQQPDKTAFVIEGLEFTYADLALAEETASLWLQSQAKNNGLPCSSLRVACRLNNGFELAVWYLASIRNHCLFVLMDPTWSSAELTHAIENTLPDVLIESVQCGQISESVDTCFAFAPRLDYGNTCTGTELPLARWLDTNTLIRQTTPRDDLFLSGFTSGSSGKPKAFVRTAESWLASFQVSADEFGTCGDSVILAPGPLSHGLSFFALAETFYHGATFVSRGSYNAGTCCEFLLKGFVLSHCLTTVVLVPSMLSGILDAVEEKRSDAPDMTPVNDSANIHVITAGAKLSTSQKERFIRHFPRMRLSEYYGASELSFVSVGHLTEQPPPDSVGRICKGVSARTRPEPDGVGLHGVGLIEVAGPLLASGYLRRINNRQVVEEITGDDGYATVGDCGYFDEAGYLYLVDREDRMFNSGGLKVFPSRVEQIATDYFRNDCDYNNDHHDHYDHCGKAVETCAVVALDDSFWGQRVCLVLHNAESTQHRDQDWIDALLSHCRSNLQRHEVPRVVVAVDQLPMTTSGKIAYHQLATQLLNSLPAEIRTDDLLQSGTTNPDAFGAQVCRWLYDADKA